jgi:S-adenosylmethionine:tRNA ribosyltransferase-isomerase
MKKNLPYLPPIVYMYSLTDYNYELPEDLIAQKPAEQRDRSNLMLLNRQTGSLSHGQFNDILNFFHAGDVLVVNDTEVIPARLVGRKETGGKVEVLLSDYAGGRQVGAKNGRFICECLVKASKRPAAGTWLSFAEKVSAQVLEAHNGSCTLEFFSDADFETTLCQIGEIPLPPYIKRTAGQSPPCDDRMSYQTVYARHKGAIAAPTAGLHFTAGLLTELKAKGIQIAPLTLHVGYGTFLPVRVDDIRKHPIHSEKFTLSQASAEIINSARAECRRVIAVGTTCVRALEFVARRQGTIVAASGACDLFIYPGYRFKVVNALLTNFHLPKSTLLMLVSAFAGRETILNAYKEAIRREYRFYSYGDAMLII